MALPAYLQRIIRVRHQNLMRHSKGVPLIFPEEEVIAMMANMSRPVNTSMQHCVLKVFPKMKGSDHEKFVSAFNICAATFVKHGYMTRGQQSLSLTAKGMQNNLRHRLEVHAGTKYNNYTSLVKKLWTVYIDKYRQGLRKQWEDTPEAPEQRRREELPAPDNMIVARPTTRADGQKDTGVEGDNE